MVTALVREAWVIGGVLVFVLSAALGTVFVGLISKDSAEPEEDGSGSNRRELGRFRSVGTAYLSRRDADPSDRALKCRLMDISTYSARVRSRRPVALGSVLRIELEELGMTTTCAVRRCERKGVGFDLGLEFQGTLYPTLRRVMSR